MKKKNSEKKDNSIEFLEFSTAIISKDQLAFAKGGSVTGNDAVIIIDNDGVTNVEDEDKKP